MSADNFMAILRTPGPSGFEFRVTMMSASDCWGSDGLSTIYERDGGVLVKNPILRARMYAAWSDAEVFESIDAAEDLASDPGFFVEYGTETFTFDVPFDVSWKGSTLDEEGNEQ